MIVEVVVENLEESEGHASTNDHFNHFVEEVLNEQNLISHLCTTKDREERPLWLVDSWLLQSTPVPS